MINFIVQILLNAVAVFGASYLLRGIHLKDFKYAIVVALVLSVLNTYIKPIMEFFAFPITFITVGLFLLVINAAIIKIAAWLIGNNFKVDGWWWAIAFSLVMTFINTILAWLLA